MKSRREGSGPAVLLLHGIPTSGRLWDEVIPRLRMDLTCVVVDLPGAGDSPPLRGVSPDPEAYAAELEVVRLDMGIEAWHVVAHDAGCVIAVHYATRYATRVRRLVLCSPPVFPEHRIAWFFGLIRQPMIGAVVAPLLTPLIFAFLWWGLGRRDLATARIVWAFARPFRGLAGARRFRALLRWGRPADVLARTAARLPLIAAPTLIVHGRRERVIPRAFAVRAAAAIPHARVFFPDCGHFMPLECPGDLSTALRRFLIEDPASYPATPRR